MDNSRSIGHGFAVSTTTPSPADEPLRAELTRAIGPVLYSDLRAHLGRGALFVVAQAVPLLDAAVAVAQNDVPTVDAMVAAATLRRPTPNEERAWSEDAGRAWLAAVVRPFVLVQDPPR